jgi:hypothetical protein
MGTSCGVRHATARIRPRKANFLFRLFAAFAWAVALALIMLAISILDPILWGSSRFLVGDFCGILQRGQA